MLTLTSSKQDQSAQKTARLGQINFINSLPVVVPLLSQVEQLHAEIVLGTPSELNKMYADDQLDLGAMSSFYFLTQKSDDSTGGGTSGMNLIEGLSISSIGAVGSVLLFSKHELHKLQNCKIAVPKSSATSINLLSVLLKEQFGVTAELVTFNQPDLTEDEFDAALVIGDRALLVDEDWSKQFLRMDMGDWWHQSYKLPMTFGVWAAKNAWSREHEQLHGELSAVLQQAARTGLGQALPNVIEESMRRLPLTHDRLERYFLRELNFQFTDEHARGLALYADLCLKHGLLSPTNK
jgi:chorismate dehydratase